VITASLEAKAAHRAELRTLLTRGPVTATPAKAGRGSFDGGARASVPSRPQTHEQWLVSLLGTPAADRPVHFQPSR
jgi:hypothetical protein